MNTAIAQVLQVEAAGALAHVALVRSGGRLRPLPAFPDSPYLLAGDDTGVYVVDTAVLAEAPGSQFFRRRLVSKFGVHRSWDWRCANAPEDDLLTTVEGFRVGQATQPA